MVTILFVVLTCIRASYNRRKKTKHIVTYFFPIAFAIVAIVDIVLYTAPRLMDVNSLINNNFYYNTGAVEQIGFMKNYFVIDGNYYYINPLRNQLTEGDVVRVKHTPYSRFTVEITTITEADDTEEGGSVKETV